METFRDVRREVFTYSNLVHAVSGMTGGIVAISTFYPLNIVRLRLQIDESLKSQSVLSVIKHIVDEEGIAGIYRGWWGCVVSLGASNFVYFYSYNAFKTLYLKALKNGSKSIDPATNLVIATIAGVINVFATTPLWIAGTRLSMQRKNNGIDDDTGYTGIIDCLKCVLKEEGFLAMWKGMGPSLMLVSNPSIQFVTYERLREPMSRLAKKRGKPITALEFFVMGAIAKTVATVLTYPIQLAQSRLRVDKGKNANRGERNYKSTLDVLQKVYAVAGLTGLFKGMEAKLWQTVLTAAFQFLTYEEVRRIVSAVLYSRRLKKK